MQCPMGLQQTDKHMEGCLSCLCSRTTHAIMRKGLEEEYIYITLNKCIYDPVFEKINLDIHIKEEIKNNPMHNIFKIFLKGRYLHSINYFLFGIAVLV